MTDAARRETEGFPDFPECPSELDPEDWRRRLDPETFRVTREGGTEPPFSGDYWDCQREGSYLCVCCGARLFDARHKFDSGTGWPSFWRPVDPADVRETPDTSHGMRRTEVLCGRCDAHLGHVFPDGPDPTGLRYCINSTALILEPGTAGRDDEGAAGEEAGR